MNIEPILGTSDVYYLGRFVLNRNAYSVVDDNRLVKKTFRIPWCQNQ